MSQNGKNQYNITTTPVTEATTSISSPSNDLQNNHITLSLDPKEVVAGNTFLSGFGPYGSRSRESLTSKIRGSSGVIQKYQNAHRVFSQEALVYQCRYFKLNYYPPEHFLGLFRKTKPAINVKETGQAQFNNNLTLDHKHGTIFRNNPSFLPKNYAVYRRLNRIFVKSHMVDEWCRLDGDRAVEEGIAQKTSKTDAHYLDKLGRTKQGIAKDGFYVYMTLVFPDKYNRQDLAHHIRQSVLTVANLKWDQFLQSKKDCSQNWVHKANSRLEPSRINKLLSSSEHDYTLSSFDNEPLDE